MVRVVLTIIVGALAGVLLGRLQASLVTQGFEERFTGSRATLAEQRGEKTMTEVLEQSKGIPQVEVEGGTQFRFGTMQHGESMSHDFIFRNVGDGPLSLDMGGSTCKCTVGELESSVLQPGETTKVTLTWTAQSATPDYGQTATILTNSPSTPEVRLVVSGQVADSFVVEPSEIALGDISVTEGLSRTFHIFTYWEKAQELSEFTWTDSKTAKLVNIECHEVELDLERFPDHRNAYRVHEVQLQIKPGLPMGPLNSRISFYTDQADKVGTLEVPVTGRVAGDIVLVGGPSFDATKNLLTMGDIKSSEGAKVSISLAIQGTKQSDISPEISSVRPAEVLQASIGEPKVVGGRKYFPVNFEVPKGAPETYYAGSSPQDFGKVVIKTNYELIPEINIYVRLRVSK
jgi:hypothetical protein